MATQRTLVFLKPDCFEKNVVGKVIGEFENQGIKLLAIRMRHLTKEEAGGFYAVHKERPFFQDLVTYVTRGPVCALVLEGDDIIKRVRDLMGATNPKEASPDTIRGKYGASLDANVVHGSDSPESAANEIPYFFSALDIGL